MRLIDADALGTIQSIQSADFNSIETIREWICRQPTIDAVPAVRCGECKYGVWMERYYNLLADKHNTITEHIEHLLSAEQENRLIVLPYKVEDTVWSAEPFKDGKPRKGSIVQINIDAGGICGFWVSFNPEPVAAEFTLEEIGKTVFFTRPEVI